MSLNSLIGKTFKHHYHHLVEVIRAVPKSRTKVVVKVIDRGAGWDEVSQSYKGVKFKGGWMRGQNYEFGTEHEVHRKELIKI